MRLLLRPFLRRLVLSAGLVLGTQAAFAQASAARPRGGYDFLTITIIKSPYKTDCRMLVTPAFQGVSEVKLEEEYTITSDRYRENLHHNTLLLNQALSELSAAGWELVETHAVLEGVSPAPVVTRYLLRKAKS
ncbi:hypothetical protein QMK33_04460 [Hymenobacter sp. H14-R3]|uniref:hypothetical protein n=1 Tax=Hymenobacter sp. H14-R3 TaxID=3046308 RepID=UPI0024B90528|nr:hypothetical protein [Hymenobacter sp. H14-R3]MDJ0364393.1 hypothetical protein [Hymenobacter sp. H14-R3]